MRYLNEQNILIFLVQVFLLLGLSRGLSEVFRRWKLPSFTVEILVGVFLGPTILGRFLPSVYQLIFPNDVIQLNMLETLAWLGVLFLLLVAGLEIDFSSAWRQKGDALKIALTGIVVPLGVSAIACYFLPDTFLANPAKRVAFTVFLATVMTISSMPVAARALHDMNLLKTDLGFLIMSALSVNDIIGWLLFTLVIGFFTQASLNISQVLIVVGFTTGFTVFCITLGRTVANLIISGIKKKQLPEPAASLTFICLLGLICGAITSQIGIHPLFGFFMAGIMAGEARDLSERTRQIISQMVYAIFIPIFFASIGLKVDFFKNFNLFLVLFISIIGIAGRFFGAWIGAIFTNISKSDRFPIAVTHIPGGTMEIVVGLLALEYRLITEPVFVAIIFAAVISSLLLGPWLGYSIKKRKELSILEYFSRRAIVPEFRTSERDEAIRMLCNLADEAEESTPDSDIINIAVLKRENEMGTAIEENIAIPHARFLTLSKPIIVFGRSSAGIEWNSPDGKPTHFVFLILTPKKDEGVQLQILSLISKIMGDKGNREEILASRDTQDIWVTLQKVFSAQHIVKRK